MLTRINRNRSLLRLLGDLLRQIFILILLGVTIYCLFAFKDPTNRELLIFIALQSSLICTLLAGGLKWRWV